MGLTCAHTSISGHQLRRRQEDVIVGCHPLWLCCSETPVCIKVRGLQQQTPGVTLSAFASSRLQSGSKCEGPAAADTSDTRWCAPHNNTKMVGATSISCNHGLPGRSCIGSECAEPAVYGLQSALLSLHLGKGAGQAFEPNVANAFRGTYAEDQWCMSMCYVSCRLHINLLHAHVSAMEQWTLQMADTGRCLEAAFGKCLTLLQAAFHVRTPIREIFICLTRS